MTGMLNFGEASAGLDIIPGFKTTDSFLRGGLTHRLIERVLDQLDAQNRKPTESEFTHLRNAIDCYALEQFEASVGRVFRACNVGNTPIFSELDPVDRTVTLREALKYVDEQGRA